MLPWVVVAAGHGEQWTGLGEVAFDAALDGGYLGGREQAADHHAAVGPEERDGGVVEHGHSSPRSLMSLATCPVAFTLVKACSTFPVGEITNVERITPVTTLPYSFFSPNAP
jgi:hypothetical protein